MIASPFRDRQIADAPGKEDHNQGCREMRLAIKSDIGKDLGTTVLRCTGDPADCDMRPSCMAPGRGGHVGLRSDVLVSTAPEPDASICGSPRL